MDAYKHVLLATDLGKESQPTAERAVSIAQKFGAKLTLLHVLEPIQSYAFGYVSTADIETELFEEAKKLMAKLGEKLKIPETDQVVEIGSIKNGVLGVAERVNSDLIILGSHRSRDFLHLLGSTANAVAHSAKCDVLIVRST